MNKTKLSPANIVILVGGVLMLIGSFLDFYKLDAGIAGSYSANAWSTANGFGLFGIMTVAVLCGVFMAMQVGLTNFATSMTLPDRLLGLTWDQVHLALASQAAILMFASLIRSKGSLSFGIGFWLMLLAAIALLVGAIMRHTGAGSSPNPAN